VLFFKQVVRFYRTLTEMIETAADPEDRFVGTLVGLALGDALGGPLEFLSRNQIQIKFGQVDEMIGGGWLDLRPGEWTDDTAMMLCLAESLVARQGFEAAAVTENYLAWYRSGPKDIGNVTRASLALHDLGGPPDEAARVAHEGSGLSAGNGTIMRCAPLGLYYRSNRFRLIESSLQDARITHWDPKAGSCSAGLNLMISILLEGERELSTVLQQAQAILEEDEQGARPLIPDPSQKSREDLRPSGYVIDTLECALWALFNTGSFRDCLVEAVNLGGDADTIGAVSGALAGAYYGFNSFPQRWVDTLAEAGRIRKLACRLMR